jgi:hypothetical protein
MAKSVMILVLFIACSSAILYSQGYGTIRGTVSDPSGAVVPSAIVTATETKTGRDTTVISGKDGTFVFPTLGPSNYSLLVSADGFEHYAQRGIILQADQALTVNVSLHVGSASSTVSVSADAPQVDTTTGTLSEVVDESRVVDLPLNGRNAASLVTLVAGVVVAPSNGMDQGVTKTFPVAVNFTANGSHVDQSDYLLNGGNNVDEMTNVNAPFPFPDALQEFSVQTSNYNAEYGQSSGAVVNIVTKSGGSQFHGDAFEFIRNGYFNAKPYFATKADTMHRHQFGGTIGGPVIIPHFSAGKTTQFFFGYQHTIRHQLSNASSATVPTLAEEGLAAGESYADFGSLCSAGWDSSNLCSNAKQQIVNPFSSVKYPLNQVPTGDLDSAAMALAKYIPTYSGTPTAGTVGGLVNYYQPTVQSFDEYFGRVDHTFSNNDHLFGHYYQNYFSQAGIYDPAMLLSYSGYANIRYQSALLSETHIFTANILNNFIANFQREIALRGGPSGSPDITTFGVDIWQPSGNNDLPGVGPTGYFSISGNAFAAWNRNNYTFNDDLHWVKGNHSFTFGGHLELSKFDVTNVGNDNGKFATSTYGSYVNALANFEMGYLTSFVQGAAENINDRNHFPGIYAQDSWRINHRLTLNYGLRWEDFAPWTNKLGGQTEFVPSAYTANSVSKVYTALPAGLLVSGDSGVASNGVNNQYKQFMPRVGFAYDIFGNGKTVLRGGGGIFYQDRLPAFFNLNQTAGTPYTISVTLSNLGGTNIGGPFSNPYCTGCTTGIRTAGSVQNPFPYTLPFPSNEVFPTPVIVREYDPSGHFQVPVTDDYNLTVEHQLFSSWAIRVAYVGSVSRHQFVNLEVNPAINNGSGLSTDQRRAYNTAPIVAPCTTSVGCAAKLTNITEASMTGSSHYNSLQATLEKKMSHGLSLLANYTWSKSLDNLPVFLSGSNESDINAGESYVYPQYPAGASSWNPTNIKALDYGPSDFDHPVAFSASYVYDLPRIRNGNSILKSVVNGWRTTGLIQHNSGDVLTILAGQDVSLTGLNRDRAQRNASIPTYLKQSGAGNCKAGLSCVNWLTPGSFALPVNTGANSGTGFGNASKGSVRGPSYTNWDAAVIRHFPIYRESNLEFRAEYFDVLNHTILGDPATSVTSSTFGEITAGGAAGPRIAQFSLKYNF